MTTSDEPNGNPGASPSSPIDIRWGWLFLDVPAAGAESTWAFWAHVLGSDLSPHRGEHDEFTTVIPPSGRPWLKLQATGDSASRTHVDLDVDDPAGAAEVAVSLGARPLGVAHETAHVMASPGGYVFCFTPASGDGQGGGGVGEEPSSVGGGHGPWYRDLGVYPAQLCVDCPADLYDEEVAFWSRLTGWPILGADVDDPFVGLGAPTWFPFALLFQRLGADDERTAVVGHPDVAVADRRSAVVAAHADGGASEVAVEEGWTVMRDPSGLEYCLCDPPPIPATG